MYIWKAITAITKDKAIHELSVGKEVYLLNDADDTGIIASSVETIENHVNEEGILGIDSIQHSGNLKITCNHCRKEVSIADLFDTVKDYAIKV